MTTTPTASPELLDLDKLEALARAATPGPWISKPHGRIVGGPLRQYVNGRTQAQIATFSVTFHEQAPDDEPERQQANTEFAAAANPASVLTLIALARRAQPEGEAPQAVAIVGNADFERGYQAALKWCDENWAKPAATLSPLCGAQHAESGASDLDAFGTWKAYPLPDLNSDGHFDKDWLHREFVAFKAGRRAALAAQPQGAQAAGYITKDAAEALLAGREYGALLAPEKSGVNQTPVFLAAQQAAAPGNSPVIPDGSTSAPGTPEAPTDTERMDWLDQNIFHRGMDDLDEMRRKETWMWVTFAPKGIQGKARSIIDAARAAQLDGGQEGSESNG